MHHILDFVQQCLLFKSSERANRIFGALAWSFIGVLVFVLYRIVFNDFS